MSDMRRMESRRANNRRPDAPPARGNKIPGSTIVGPGTNHLYLRKPGHLLGPDGKAVSCEPKPPVHESFSLKYRLFLAGCPVCRWKGKAVAGSPCPNCRYPKLNSPDYGYYRMFGELPISETLQQGLLRELRYIKQTEFAMGIVHYTGAAREFFRQTKWGRINVLKEAKVSFA